MGSALRAAHCQLVSSSAACPSSLKERKVRVEKMERDERQRMGKEIGEGKLKGEWD